MEKKLYKFGLMDERGEEILLRLTKAQAATIDNFIRIANEADVLNTLPLLFFWEVEEEEVVYELDN